MKKRLLLTGCVFFVSLNALAFDPLSVFNTQSPQGCIDKDITQNKIGLPELLEIGFCNNPMLNKGYMQVKTSQAELGSAKSEYLPSVNVDGSLSKTYSNGEEFSSFETDPYSANIGLSWLIYDFGGRSARLEREKKYLDAAGFQYNALLKDTFLSINNAYFELLGAQEILKSAKTSEASFKKSFEESSKRYELGLVSLSDKLLAKTSYEESRLEVVQAENQVKTSQGKLAMLLNVSPETKFNLLKPKNDKDLTKLEMGDMPVSEMIETALTLRPEIQKSQKDVEAAVANVKVQKAAALPKISFSAKMGMNDDWRKESLYQYGSSVGINVSVPLFTGFSDTYKIKQAEYQKEQAFFSKEDVTQTVKNEVWTAYHNYKTAVSSYDISKKALESAKENERVAFASYQVGKGDILNLLTAGSQLSTARKEVIVAYYSVLTSKATLYRAIGRF
ncbi:MAG: TolC family protein [Alphaproteobacteria bacterium]|nr:TolC family protein [Alphaproteobacteria bacterium]